jgi:uncharacterized protein YndB with AHSA1/START domain
MADEALDGRITRDDNEYWIEFDRHVDHSPAEVWAALTEPRRLVLWQQPVDFFPGPEIGATIYAHLNPQVNAIALGIVTEVDPPTNFAYRWTTNNPMLPPDFNLRYTLGKDSVLHVQLGPFGPNHGVVPLTASVHIHLDHLEEAITMSADCLPSPPWPEMSVVARSGKFPEMAKSYRDKFSKEFPELPQAGPNYMRQGAKSRP